MTEERTPVIDTEPAANGTPAANGSEYTGQSVRVLQNRDHIRERPGMYIGDTSTKGLHHLVYELVYNSVDEALAGYCKHMVVKIDVDGSISVADDGRGIPVEAHSKTGRSTLELVMTSSGTSGKFDKRSYKTSAGLHGIGAKAVTALSEWCIAEVRRNGKVYEQHYARGKYTTDVQEGGDAPQGRTGTKLPFKPAPEISHDARFDFDTLENRLRELAFLNKGLAIKLIDARPGKEKEAVYEYHNGVA